MFQLRVGDALVYDEAAMAEAVFRHFYEIIGSADHREFALEFDVFDNRTFDLSALEQPFSEAEIWEAVKKLPSGKSPSPGGFTSEFLRPC